MAVADGRYRLRLQSRQQSATLLLTMDGHSYQAFAFIKFAVKLDKAWLKQPLQFCSPRLPSQSASLSSGLRRESQSGFSDHHRTRP